MKKLDFKQDFLAIKRVIESIKTSNSPLVIWQNGEGKRLLKLVYVEGNLFDHQLVWLRAEEGSSLLSLTQGEAYIFCSAKQVVGKVKIKELQKDILSLYYPKELFLITSEKEDMVDTYDQFSTQNKLSGNQDKKEGFSNLEKISFNDQMGDGSFNDLSIIWGTNWKDFGTITKSPGDGPVECPLLDYSSGGASFLFHNASYFQKDDKITFVAKNKNNNVISGEIISIQVFNENDSTYKISIRF
jgi:hypothetical protein